jgi:hypothetical protein
MPRRRNSGFRETRRLPKLLLFSETTFRECRSNDTSTVSVPLDRRSSMMFPKRRALSTALHSISPPAVRSPRSVRATLQFRKTQTHSTRVMRGQGPTPRATLPLERVPKSETLRTPTPSRTQLAAKAIALGELWCLSSLRITAGRAWPRSTGRAVCRTSLGRTRSARRSVPGRFRLCRLAPSADCFSWRRSWATWAGLFRWDRP